MNDDRLVTDPRAATATIVEGELVGQQVFALDTVTVDGTTIAFPKLPHRGCPM